MNIFKFLFGVNEENEEEKRKAEDEKKFDLFKYDGVRAMRTGQAQYAVKCFTHALDIKDDMECRDYLSTVLIRTGELAAAYEQLRKLVEVEPDNPKIYMRIADVAYMMENYNVMADACEQVLLLDGDDPVAYYYYARACRGQHDMVNAVAMLSKAIMMRDDYYDAYLLRGNIYLEEGDADDAVLDADFLLEHVGENEDVLLLKARAENALSHKNAAIDAYGKAIDLNPFCITALRERASLRLATGDETGARADNAAADEVESKYA